jgi:hypothetical protein
MDSGGHDQKNRRRWRPQSRGRGGSTARRMDQNGPEPSGHDRRRRHNLTLTPKGLGWPQLAARRWPQEGAKPGDQLSVYTLCRVLGQPAHTRTDEGAAGCADFAGRTGRVDFDPTRPHAGRTTCPHLWRNRHNSTAGNGWHVGCSPSTDLTTRGRGKQASGKGCNRLIHGQAGCNYGQHRGKSNTGRSNAGRAGRA